MLKTNQIKKVKQHLITLDSYQMDIAILIKQQMLTEHGCLDLQIEENKENSTIDVVNYANKNFANKQNHYQAKAMANGLKIGYLQGIHKVLEW